MKILIISGEYPPRIGGGGMYAYYLAHALADAGQEVHVLTDSSERASLYPSSHPDRVVVHTIGHSTAFERLELDGALKRGLSVLDGAGFDLIHANHFGATFLAVHLGCAYHLPVVASLQKVPPLAAHMKAEAGIFRRDPQWCSAKVLSQMGPLVTLWIANSKVYVGGLAWLKVPKSKIRLVYPGVPIERFTAPVRMRKSGPQTVLCPSRLDNRKGLDLFLDAAIAVSRGHKRDQLHFRITGDVELTKDKRTLRNQLLSRAKKEGVSLKIEPVPLAEMPALYHRSLICVLPSSKEGLGIVLLEAMASSTPVVATGTPGILEVIKDEKNGLLFQSDNVGDLAAQIGRLADSESLRKTLAEGGQETVSTLFSSTGMARNHIRVYREAIKLMKT